MIEPQYVEAVHERLLTEIREHAFSVLALEHTLTMLPTEHGAKTPWHWVEQTDRKIASVLPSSALIDELVSRGYDVV